DCQTKRRAVRELRAEKLTPRVGMRIHMHHPDRPLGAEGPEDGVGDRVIATGAYWQDAGSLDRAVERLDVLVLPLEVITVGQVHVAEIGNAAQLIWIDAQPKIEPAHQARSVADLARAMPCARTVGNPEIGRDTDESDVDVVKCGRKRGAHEGRDLGK